MAASGNTNNIPAVHVSIFKKNLLSLLRHLGNHKYRHCFQDTLYPLSDCGNDTEIINVHFPPMPGFPLLDKSFRITLEILTDFISRQKSVNSSDSV